MRQLSVAIVEDNPKEAERLEEFLARFSEEADEDFEVTRFSDALAFLDAYRGADLVFMDIEMPYMNGLEGAKRLRERDSQVTLIFVTNMAQYAVKGYEVNALDFIVKPVAYSDFVFKLKRALNDIASRRVADITVLTHDGLRRISSGDLVFVEVRGHNLTYHIRGGETVEARGRLSDAKEQLSAHSFLRCHNSILVNPRCIESVAGSSVSAAGEELPISRPRRRQFLDELAHWYAGGGV